MASGYYSYLSDNRGCIMDAEYARMLAELIEAGRAKCVRCERPANLICPECRSGCCHACASAGINCHCRAPEETSATAN